MNLFLFVFSIFVKESLSRSNTPFTLSNWARNFRFSTQDIQYPRDISEVISIVKNVKGKIRVLGAQHSFTKIADCEDTLISTHFLREIIKLDESIPSIAIEAGVTYADLKPYIESRGFSILNMPGSNEISIVGAAQTATGGNGISLGNIASQICSLEIVLPNGTVTTLGPNDPELKAVALGLGVFGVITKVEVKIQPSFKTNDHHFLGLPVQSIYDHFYDIQNLGQVESLFTDLSDLTSWTHLWIRVPADNDTIGDIPELYNAKRANGTVTFGDLTGFAQWFIPYENAVPAIKDFIKFGKKIRTLIKAASIRTIGKDDLWMSPCYQSKCMALEVFWETKDLPFLNTTEALVTIEEILKPHNARPHWGKVHDMKSNYYAKFYPKMKDFKYLADEWDPQKKFRNDFVDHIFENDL